MTVKDRGTSLTISALCEVCARQHPHRRDGAGYVMVDLDQVDGWVLYWHSQRLGRTDSARDYDGAWGRMKAPNLVARGPRRVDGSLRTFPAETRLRCPRGHRLQPAGADLHYRITTAVERRLGYVEIPE